MFKQLSEMIDGYTINLSIRKESQNLIVLVVPKIEALDSVNTEIVPLTITGTPDELNESFVKILQAGTSKLIGIQSNIEEFSESVDKAVTKARKPKESKKKEVKSPELLIESEEKKDKTVDAFPADQMPLDEKVDAPVIASPPPTENNDVNDEEAW